MKRVITHKVFIASFIYTVLCKLIDCSNFFSRYTMYRHFVWCAFGKSQVLLFGC